MDLETAIGKLFHDPQKLLISEALLPVVKMVAVNMEAVLHLEDKMLMLSLITRLFESSKMFIGVY